MLSANKTLKPTLENKESSSLLFWSALGATLLFLFVAPFKTGLFNGYTPQFMGPIYSAVAWGSIILLLISFYLMYFWKLTSMKDLLSVYIWFIPLAYFVSSFNAPSPQLSHDMTLISFLYATLFLSGLYLTGNSFGRQWIQPGLLLSGYCIVWFGFMNLFGNHFFLHAVMNEGDRIRLTSVFQYPNAYASFLIAILFCCLTFIVCSRKSYWKFINSFMLVPIILSFLMTLSRGAIIVIPIIFMVILPFFRSTKQVTILFHLIVSTVISLLIVEKTTAIGIRIFNIVGTTYNPSLDKANTISVFHSDSIQGWALILGVSILCSIISLGIEKYANPFIEKKSWSNKKYSRFYIPVFLVLILTATSTILLTNKTIIHQVFPSSLADRLEKISFKENSFLEREVYFKDSLKIVKDYPILGSGGGGWATLYEKYQNHSYISRQAHNFFMQLLVEVGLFGFISFVTLLIFAFYFYIRTFAKNVQSSLLETNFIFFIVTIALLLHSILDFEMSFVYLASLLFFSIGGMCAYIKLSPFGWLERREKYIKFPLTGLFAVLSIVIFVSSIRNMNANSHYRAAIATLNKTGNFNETINSLNQAIKAKPYHPDYLSTKINLLTEVYKQSNDQKYLTEASYLVSNAKQKEPNNRLIIEADYQLQIARENLPAALDIVTEASKLFRWDQNIYERTIGLNVQLGNLSKQQNKPDDAKKYWQQAIAAYNILVDKTIQLQNMIATGGPWPNKPFTVTTTTNLQIGQIYFLLGDYSKASEILKYSFKEEMLNDTNHRLGLRWYLVSLIKQNQNDSRLYDLLIKTNPNEKTEIESLLRL